MRNVQANDYNMIGGVDHGGKDPRRLPLKAWTETFTQGRCWELALKLNEITGWKVMMTDAHAFVRHPDGRYFDITGWVEVDHRGNSSPSDSQCSAYFYDNAEESTSRDDFIGWGWWAGEDLDDDILTYVAQRLLRKYL